MNVSPPSAPSATAQPSEAPSAPPSQTPLVEALGHVAAVLERANPKERANVYAALGVTLTHQPGRDLIAAHAVPALDRESARGGVGGAC